MNQVNLIGRITKDLELRTTESGKCVCEFSIAVNRLNDGVDFINIIVWEKQAENLCKYQSKGSLIGVSGSIRVDTYQDKDGNTKYKNYVLANHIEYLQSKKEGNSNNGFEDIKTIKIDEIDESDELPW